MTVVDWLWLQSDAKGKNYPSVPLVLAGNHDPFSIRECIYNLMGRLENTRDVWSFFSEVQNLKPSFQMVLLSACDQFLRVEKSTRRVTLQILVLPRVPPKKRTKKYGKQTLILDVFVAFFFGRRVGRFQLKQSIWTLEFLENISHNQGEVFI